MYAVLKVWYAGTVNPDKNPNFAKKTNMTPQ